jgi:drug/metabolite transporter (DMT)-like permease
LCYNIRVLSIVLAATSAAVWGTGDFSGGRASRRADALAVTVVSQVASLPVLAVCLAFVGGTPTVAGLTWGALAGVAGFVGIVLLYRGLAQGAMALFAPVTAVTAAVVPLAVGLILDRTPSPLALTGAVCAVLAIGLVSLSGGGTRINPRLVGLALASGLMFGVFFTLLGRAGGVSAGLWPVVGVRIGSVGVGLLAVARRRTSLRLTGSALRWSLIAGPLDILANVLYALAAARGELSVVAPISALYPVSTVLLALSINRERLRPVQFAGLGLAATALVLVAT